MKAFLICPCDRPGAAFFSRHTPLALTPLLGRSALDRALAELAQLGFKTVRILTADSPAEIRNSLDENNLWGLQIEVMPVPNEEASKETIMRLGTHIKKTDYSGAVVVKTLNSWPGENGAELWKSGEGWLKELLNRIDEAGRDSVGMREAAPGVWVSTKARISPTANLIGPCWIGKNAWICPDAVVGPGVIVEEDACVDEHAEISESFIGPQTYVGAWTEVRKSLVWGKSLMNWETGSFTEVPDAFLLGDLSASLRRKPACTVLGRMAALATLVATSPVALYAWLRASYDGLPTVITHRGVRTPLTGDLAFAHTLVWHEFNGVRGFLRRWPELWNIVRGDFAWVGNRPLTRERAGELSTDYERLWMNVAPGLVSMADAEGHDGEPYGDIARAHAAFYSAHASSRLNASLFLQAARRILNRHLPLPILPPKSSISNY